MKVGSLCLLTSCQTGRFKVAGTHSAYELSYEVLLQRTAALPWGEANA